MTTKSPAWARHPANKADEDGQLLVAEVEHFLAALRRTAHPLVSKTTDELIAEALATPLPTASRHRSQPELPESPLRGPWRILPDRILQVRRPRGPVDHRPLSVLEHLQLTAAVLSGCGWAKGRMRTRSGRRCIAGAQRALWYAGFGDLITAGQSCGILNSILRSRGERRSFEIWNDDPRRTFEQVMDLLNTAIQHAAGER